MNTTAISSGTVATPTPVPPVANPPKDATGKPVPPKLLKGAKQVRADGKTAPKPKPDKHVAEMLATIGGTVLDDATLAERVTNAIRGAASAEVRALTSARVQLAEAFELVAGKLLADHIADPNRAFGNAILARVKTIASEEIEDKRDVSKGKGLAPPKGAQVIRLRKIRLWQTVSTNTLVYACRAAALLADTKRSRVVIGYLPLPKGAVPHTLLDKTFNSTKPSKGDYLAAVCAPQNVLEPKEHRGVAAKADAEGNYKAEMVITNPNDALRMLSDQHVNTLYFHHFHDGTQPALRYADTTRDPQWAPSGMLQPMNGAGQYPAATRQANAGTGATTAASLVSRLTNDDPVKLAIMLGESFRAAPVPQWRPQGKVHEMVAATLEAAALLIERACKENLWMMPQYREGPAGAALADLCNTVNSVCRVDAKTGKAEVLNNAGSWMPLATDASPIIPKPKVVKAATPKGKAAKAA